MIAYVAARSIGVERVNGRYWHLEKHKLKT
jgi:hypothetical protein